MTRLHRWLSFWARHPGLQFGVGVLVFALVNLTVQSLRHRGILSLPWLIVMEVLFLAAVFTIARKWVTPAFSRMAPSHERITRRDEWRSALSPDAALDAVARTVTAAETGPTPGESTREPGELRLFWGSDEIYRVKGAASDKGWAALPVAAVFTAESAGPGSRLTAEVRDNLGWYSMEPAPFVENEVHRRGDDIIRRAQAATRGPDTPA